MRYVGLTILVAIASVAVLWQPSLQRSVYPNRAIKLVVPFGPGGGSDTFARMMKQAIDENRLLPQPLVIVNKKGAGTTTGSRYVKNAKPDGYTILLLHEAILTAKYSGKVSYGPEAFEPIAGTGRQGLVIAVAEESRHETLTDLLGEARERPDELVFAANLGAPVHFVGSMLEQHFPGARFRFSQSGGGANRLHDLIGGHADVSAFSIEEYINFKPSGIRAVALCDEQRHDAAPEVPTSFEQGVPVKHVNMQFWWAPKGTPQEYRDVLAKALEQAMQTQRVRARMAQLHCDPVFVRGEAMQEQVEILRAGISQVDLRATTALPDIPTIAACVAGLLGLVVVVQTAREQSRFARSELMRDIDRRSAVVCSALTLVYVISLSVEGIGFRLTTFVYVLLVGAVLTRFDKSKTELLLIIATVMSAGTYAVFTQVFSLVLP